MMEKGCFDEEILTGYLEGRFPDNGRDKIDAHLSIAKDAWIIL